MSVGEDKIWGGAAQQKIHCLQNLARLKADFCLIMAIFSNYSNVGGPPVSYTDVFIANNREQL